MARARNIKPGFFSNETLAELQPLARLLFIGLWTVADREGRLEDRPQRIKALVLPYDDCDVEVLLANLAEKRDSDGEPAFIMRYEASRKRFIQIVNWHKHQQPHCKEKPSTLPEPGLHPASTVQAPDKQSASRVQESEEHGSSTPDSLNLIPDSLTPLPLSEGEARAETIRAPTKPEVEAYILEKGYTFTAEAFVDHYEANGWKRGKTPIVDWKAACRTWAHNREVRSSTPRPPMMDPAAAARDIATLREARKQWPGSLEQRGGKPDQYLTNTMARVETKAPHPPEVVSAIHAFAEYLGTEAPC